MKINKEKLLKWIAEQQLERTPDDPAFDTLEGCMDRQFSRGVIKGLQMVYDHINEMTSDNNWFLSSLNSPVIPEGDTEITVQCCNIPYLFLDGKPFDHKSYPMKYCRRTVRGKTVERWEWVSGTIAYSRPDFWKYMDKPIDYGVCPYLLVCGKCTLNKSICDKRDINEICNCAKRNAESGEVESK